MRPIGNGRLQRRQMCGILFCLGIIVLGAVCCGISRTATSTQFFSLSSGQCQGAKATSVAGEQTLTLVVQTGPNITLCILRASDGILLKNYDLDVYGNVVGHGDGLLYVNEIGETLGDSRALCAVRISNGIKLWCQTQMHNIASIVVDKGNVYARSADQTVVTTVSERDGRILWKFQTQADAFLAVPPIITTGTSIIYIHTYQAGVQSTPGFNSVCALKSNNGQQLWCKLFSQSSITSLAADENTLYVQTINDSALYALNSANGSARWQTSFSSTPATDEHPEIILASGIVFVEVPEENTAYALRAGDGQQLWNMPFQTPIDSITATDNFIYLLTPSGELDAFKILDGTLVWSYRSAVAPANSLPTNFLGNIFVVNNIAYLFMSSRYTAYLQALNANDGTAVWDDKGCTSTTPTPGTPISSTDIPAATGTINTCYWMDYSTQLNKNIDWFLIDG